MNSLSLLFQDVTDHSWIDLIWRIRHLMIIMRADQVPGDRSAREFVENQCSRRCRIAVWEWMMRPPEVFIRDGGRAQDLGHGPVILDVCRLGDLSSRISHRSSSSLPLLCRSPLSIREQWRARSFPDLKWRTGCVHGGSKAANSTPRLLQLTQQSVLKCTWRCVDVLSMGRYSDTWSSRKFSKKIARREIVKLRKHTGAGISVASGNSKSKFRLKSVPAGVLYLNEFRRSNCT